MRFVSIRKKWFTVLVIFLFLAGAGTALLIQTILPKKEEKERSVPEAEISTETAMVRLKDAYIRAEGNGTYGVISILEVTNKSPDDFLGVMVTQKIVKGTKEYSVGNRDLSFVESQMGDVMPYFQNEVRPIVQQQTVTIAKWTSVDLEDIDKTMVLRISFGGVTRDIPVSELRIY